MVIVKHVEGYENFCTLVQKFKPNEKYFLYFGGSKLPSGESWCSDCVRAEPAINEMLPKFDQDTHFVYVLVGDRPTWKDPKCPFRTDPRTRLMVLPTISKWNSPQKLEGDQCEKIELLEMLLEDD